VRLSYREKQSLYHNLAQLLRTGVSFPSAVQKLAATSHGRLRRLLQKLHDSAIRGLTVAESFAEQRGTLGGMETSVVGAAERTGRMDHGLQQLAQYFEALAQARETVIRKAMYPLFVLHFGVLALATPTLINRGIPAYTREVATILLFVYGVAVAIALVAPTLRDAGAISATADRMLRRLPLLGKVRRAFALARFCLIYEVQLDAGVNILDALQSAARASRSGMVRETVERALPEVRTGSQVGPLLAVSGVFPDSMMRAFLVGEETGGLDRELQRMASEYQAEALVRLETVTEWTAKLLYLGVAVYIAWRIVATYQSVLSGYEKMLDL
jgi:type II secretory pathway component PulF